MRKGTDFWLAGALLLAVFLVAVNVYRAATQSFTIDEAYFFHRFLVPPISVAWASYDANHHVLLGLLCRACLAVFGPGELSLRAPVVAGGALYLVSVCFLARRLTSSGPLFLAAFACVAVNPFLLDFLSACRGYGLALGLFSLALLVLAREELGLLRMAGAGVCLGLSVGANLVFAIPAGAVMAAVALRRLRELWRVVVCLGLPMAVVAAGITVVPMLHVARGDFFYGSKTIDVMVTSLVRSSFQHTAWFGFMSLAAREQMLSGVVIACSVGLILAACMRAARRTGKPDACSLVLNGFGFTVALIVMLHMAGGLLYPHKRTGIYLPVLFTLALVAAVEMGKVPYLRAGLAMVLGVVAVCFAAEWNTRFYEEWSFDAGTREMVERLERMPHPEHTKLAASWMLSETLNYYRETRKLSWLEPVERGNLAHGGDFYLLAPEDAGLVEQKKLKVISRDPRSYEVLARE